MTSGTYVKLYAKNIAIHYCCFQITLISTYTFMAFHYDIEMIYKEVRITLKVILNSVRKLI